MADENKGGRFGNIKAQLSDGSTRIRFFGGLAVIFVAVIVAYVSLRKSVNTAGGLPSEVPTVPAVNEQHAAEGARVNPAYDQLLAKQNAAQAAQAAQTGDSAVPVIRPAADSSREQPAAAQTTAVPAAAPAAPAATTADVAAREQAAQQQRQEQQRAYQEAVTAKATAMKNQVNLLIAAWQPKDHASLSVREVPKDAAVASAATTTAGATSTANTTASKVVKAGETFYVLPDTVANTGGVPTVTAIIQNGALSGTRVLGRVEMAQNADGPVLRFKSADVKGYATSQSIDAVAIDPSFLDVDHHYLLRTVAVLGSSFLSGYGDALLKGGQSQQVVASTTGTLVQTDPYSTKQLVQIGLGNVGKTVGNNIGSLINKEPTVSVDQQKAQAGFAIILLSDMTLK